MALLHVSYDPVRKFVPRVPKNRLEIEDAITPRICVAPTIVDCINAKFGQAAPLIFAKEQSIPIVLYVYEFDKAEYTLNKTAYNPCRVQQDFGVIDAILNAESWLLTSPLTVKKRVVVVEDFELAQTAPDAKYPRVKSIQITERQRRPSKSIQFFAKEVNKRTGTHFGTDYIFTSLYETSRKQKMIGDKKMSKKDYLEELSSAIERKDATTLGRLMLETEATVGEDLIYECDLFSSLFGFPAINTLRKELLERGLNVPEILDEPNHIFEANLNTEDMLLCELVWVSYAATLLQTMNGSWEELSGQLCDFVRNNAGSRCYSKILDALYDYLP